MQSFHLKTIIDMNPTEVLRLEQSTLGQLFRRHYLRNKLSQAYYEAYLGPEFVHRSYVLYDEKEPVLMIPCLSKSGYINFAEQPTIILSILEGDDYCQAISFFINCLKKLKPCSIPMRC